jgi:hypothetical protein
MVQNIYMYWGLQPSEAVSCRKHLCILSPDLQLMPLALSVTIGVMYYDPPFSFVPGRQLRSTVCTSYKAGQLSPTISLRYASLDRASEKSAKAVFTMTVSKRESGVL